MVATHLIRNMLSRATRSVSNMSSASIKVAVLFQDIEPPVINGVRKPKKPGGYQDSGADIAYTLQNKGVSVLTPKATPNPLDQEGWCFPDTEEGIVAAVRQGATHLWANTILFASHPLRTSLSSILTARESQINVVGQPPSIVEKLDDKAYLNGKLNELGSFTLPRSWLIQRSPKTDTSLDTVLQGLGLPQDAFPIVGKPVRGRGSHGVQVCQDYSQLKAHLTSLLQESPLVMLEEYLAGEEATLTIMPPSTEYPDYWCLPPVRRFNHIDGVAPYNGTVAVTANSAVVELNDQNPEHEPYRAIMREGEQVARLIKTTAPIRIDVRRFREEGPFALFDINMKPNMTGPGRPGRENQASLTALAATAIGWDYATLLEKILASSAPLSVWRKAVCPI